MKKKGRVAEVSEDAETRRWEMETGNRDHSTSHDITLV